MKILLADDHILFRDAFIQYLKKTVANVDIAAADSIVKSELILHHGFKPDLIILDYQMPGMFKFSGLKKLREKFPSVPVALMSGVIEDYEVKEAIELGISAYFPKTMAGQDILKGMKKAIEGGLFFPKGICDSSYYPSHYMPDESEKNLHDKWLELKKSSREDEKYFNCDSLGVGNLTPREKDVAEYLLEGRSNQQIADGLGLKVVTVKLHVRSIFKKLGVKNRTQAAMLLNDIGWTR